MRCVGATYTRPVADERTTPLAKKLGINADQRVRLYRAPRDWNVASLPPGVRVVRRSTPARNDVVVAFFTNLATLERDVASLASSITSNGSLWIAWPRRAGGHTSDITDNDVRACALALGLVDVKVAALDEDWSALKMVWRIEHRARIE